MLRGRLKSQVRVSPSLWPFQLDVDHDWLELNQATCPAAKRIVEEQVAEEKANIYDKYKVETDLILWSEFCKYISIP